MNAGIVLDVVVRDDQNWAAGLPIIGAALLLLLAGVFGTQSLAVRMLPINEPDPITQGLHIVCTADDPCDRVICLHEQPTACPGTVDRGCQHVGSFVCDNHRLSDCDDCLMDARHDAGVLG